MRDHLTTQISPQQHRHIARCLRIQVQCPIPDSNNFGICLAPTVAPQTSAQVAPLVGELESSAGLVARGPR